MKSKMIRVSEPVWKTIIKHAKRPLTDTPDSVLRRLLKLPEKKQGVRCERKESL